MVRPVRRLGWHGGCKKREQATPSRVKSISTTRRVSLETHNLLIGDHAKGKKRPSGDYLRGSKVQPHDEVDDFGFNTTSPPVKPPWILRTLCQGGSPEEQVAETSRPLKARSKARLKAAIVYSLTTIIPFLVLLYIIHVGVLSGGRVNVAWVSCLALVALAIALLG